MRSFGLSFIRFSGYFLLTTLIIPFSLYAVGISSSGEVWTYRPVAGYVDATPAVADVDGDGIPDLVMATTGGTVVALDANGHVKWKYNIHSIISNPVAVGGDPLRVWVLTNAGGVWCLDARSGRKLWSYSLPGGFPWGMTCLLYTSPSPRD